MLCFLDYRYENEDIMFLGTSYGLGGIECSHNGTVSLEHSLFSWSIANKARKAFSGLSMHFPGHSYIGYVTICTRVAGTQDQISIRLSRGGNKKVHCSPRHPPIRFYNYLADGTKLEIELIPELTEELGRSTNEDVEKFEILLEMRVIKSVMEPLRKMPPDQASLAHKARVDTACNVIEAFPKDEARRLSDFFRFLESYGFKSYDADEHEAERIVYERLAGRQAVEATESLGGD